MLEASQKIATLYGSLVFDYNYVMVGVVENKITCGPFQCSVEVKSNTIKSTSIYPESISLNFLILF